jgi:hypothetical protein
MGKIRIRDPGWKGHTPGFVLELLRTRLSPAARQKRLYADAGNDLA